MENIFLRMKHWQLFLIIFMSPMVFYVYMMQRIVLMVPSMEKAAPEFESMSMFSVFGYFIPILMVSFVVWIAYMLTLMRALNDRKPDELRRSLRFPIFCLLFAAIYIIVISVSVSIFFFNMDITNGMESIDPKYILRMMGIIIPSHFFSMFSIFYVFYVNASSLKTVELQRKPKGDEFIGEFLLFWLFPIGIWFLQPRINKLFGQE